MSYQNIAAALTQTQVSAIKAHIAAIAAELPFLIGLTPTERRNIMKLGPKSADFVRNANHIARHYGHILPARFNAAALAQDSALFEQLSEIQLLLDALCEKVNDTTTAVGNEAMKASLQVYDYVKAAADAEPGLKTVAEELNQRFKRPKRRGKPQPE